MYYLQDEILSRLSSKKATSEEQRKVNELAVKKEDLERALTELEEKKAEILKQTAEIEDQKKEAEERLAKKLEEDKLEVEVELGITSPVPGGSQPF